MLGLGGFPKATLVVGRGGLGGGGVGGIGSAVPCVVGSDSVEGVDVGGSVAFDSVVVVGALGFVHGVGLVR